MSIKQRIDAQTDALSALLTYANDATQAGDADIGEAIRTLVDGYEKGSGNPSWVHAYTITPDADTKTVPITDGFAPTGDYAICAYSTNLPSGTVGSTNRLTNASVIHRTVSNLHVGLIASLTPAGAYDTWSTTGARMYIHNGVVDTNSCFLAGGYEYKIIVLDLENISTGGSGGLLEEIPLTVLQNQYYGSTGNLIAYNGWDATEPVDLSQYDGAVFVTGGNIGGAYLRAWDENGSQSFQLVSYRGYTHFYFGNLCKSAGVSGSRENMAGVKAYGIKLP